MNMPESLVSTITRFFEKRPGVLLVFLFGSHASQTARADSDVDIGVLLNEPFTGQSKLALVQDLEEALQKPVDLIDLATARGVILTQILTRGKLLLNNDPNAYEQLLKRMIYDEADYMPLYRRTVEERVRRFIHG